MQSGRAMWQRKPAPSIWAEIKMYAHDRQGLLMEMSKIFTECKIDVKSMNVRTSKQGTATIEAGFIVHGREELIFGCEKIKTAGRRYRH